MKITFKYNIAIEGNGCTGKCGMGIFESANFPDNQFNFYFITKMLAQ